MDSFRKVEVEVSSYVLGRWRVVNTVRIGPFSVIVRSESNIVIGLFTEVRRVRCLIQLETPVLIEEFYRVKSNKLRREGMGIY